MQKIFLFSQVTYEFKQLKFLLHHLEKETT